jgi:hypothetical protein
VLLSAAFVQWALGFADRRKWGRLSRHARLALSVRQGNGWFDSRNYRLLVNREKLLPARQFL